MKFIVLIIALIISRSNLSAQSSLTVKSKAFADKNYIPFRYTCDGLNINPAISIEGIPNGAKSLVLIMDDTESPNGEFTHWVMWNIPPKKNIQENSAPGVQGMNSMDKNNYFGPCPPNGMHKYHFKVYALDTKLNLPLSTDKKALLEAINGHVLVLGELIGLYYRH